MQIKALFFGATAAAVGERTIHVDLTEDSNTGEAITAILDVYPKLKKFKLIFAVNEEYYSGARVLADGDELAIFTAVSGG